MDDSDTHDMHEPDPDPSTTEPNPHEQAGSDVTLRVEWRTGPRTQAWDELWRRLLARVRERTAADGDPDEGEMPPGAPPSLDNPNS